MLSPLFKRSNNSWLLYFKTIAEIYSHNLDLAIENFNELSKLVKTDANIADGQYYFGQQIGQKDAK